MRKYIFTIIILCYNLQGIAQNNFIPNNVNLQIDSSQFKLKKGENEFFQFVPETNSIILPHKDLDKISPKNQKQIIPAMKSMSLSQIPHSYSIDKTKSVGEIEIESNITNGVVAHTIPINTYSSELDPDIAIAYNSMAGNGAVGYGWNISGLSGISIVNSNYYFDGVNYMPAQLNKSTAFALNGMRLIKTSETTSQINYQSEQNNIKVISYIPSGKYYFEVYYPDGRKATFGYKTNTSQFKIAYPITRLENSTGGYIDYQYLESSNMYYISEINYGKFSTKIGTIKFTYTTRPDKSTSHKLGRTILSDKRLSKVETYYQAKLLRTFSMSYEEKQYSFLSKVSCKSGIQELNPLLFYYGEDTYGNSSYFLKDMAFLESYFANSKAPDLVLNKGKFNSQMTSDGLVAYPKFDVFGVSGYDKKGNCTYESRYSETQNILIFKNLGEYLCTPHKIQTGRGFQGLYPVDYNGDGDDELVRVNYWLHDNSNAKLDITTYDKNMTPKNSSYLLEGTFAEGGRNSAVPRTFITGDFLGEGKTQLLAISGYKMPKGETRSSSRTTLFNLDSRSKIYDSTPFKFDYFKDVVFAIDYDGDGRTDICLINENGTYIYAYYGGTFKQIALYPNLKRGDITGHNCKELLIGDINGDGLVDFLLSPRSNQRTIDYVLYPCRECSGCRYNSPTLEKCQNPIRSEYSSYLPNYKTWTLLTNTGTTFKEETFEFLSNTSTNNSKFQYLLQDINGDHLPDLVIKEYSTISAYLNLNGKINTTKESATLTVDEDAHFISGGVGNGLYGNRRPSHVLSIKDAQVTPITFSRNDARERLMTGAINSLGVISHYNYTNLTSGSNYWTTNAVVSYPYNKLYMDMNVVASTDTYINNQNVASNTFYYTDAIIHRQGGGFKGFQKVTTHDNKKGVKLEQLFDYSKYGTIKSSDSPTSSATYNYDVNVASNKIAKVTLTSKIEKDKLKGNSITTSYTYDAYCNPTLEIVDFGNGAKHTISNTYKYHTSLPYYLCELSERVETSTANGSSVKKRTLSTYNTKFLPLTKKEYYNDKLVLEEELTYNTNNLISSTKIKQYSSEWLITNYTYTPFFKLDKRTDPSGLSITHIYNDKGELSSTKDHKGLETKYEYDLWGDISKTTFPDGSFSTTSTAWSTYGLYCHTFTVLGKPTQKNYYDALKRIIRKGELRFDGKELKQDTQYDNIGRVAKVSQPFSGTSPILWNSYSYDPYDRILSYIYASGKKDTYSYRNNSISTTIDGISKTETYNNLQQLIETVDLGGKITYSYRADGEISKIIAPGNIVTEFGYDEYGRQTSLDDPSAGKKTYTYDKAGNITKETDARGKVIITIYNKLNQVIQKVIDGVTTTYTYTPEGQISTISSSNGLKKIVTYDPKIYQKIVSEKEEIVDGKWLEKIYSYANGNISSIGYKSSESANTIFAIENFTYTNGHLQEVKLGNTSVWKLNSENELGKSNSISTGVLTHTYGYSKYGMPTSITAKKGSVFIQDFQYEFNHSTGNLLSRKDRTRNLEEVFGYDNLNRLTSFGGKIIKYDKYGNISDISTLGSFMYQHKQPYAISTFTPYGISQMPIANQFINYNSQMRVTSITEGTVSSIFTYSSTGSRVKILKKKSGKDDLTRYYLSEGKYEIEKGITGNKERLYIGGDVYSAAAVYIKENGSWTINYICRDYLGSITHITKVDGTLIQEISYDAWGRLRNPINHTIYESSSTPKLILNRGYTGHEHLIEHNLINMNARLYDPILGRFLSPDPWIQNPMNSQNFNRFGYALNNPLKFTDPDGEFIVAAIIGTVVGAWIGGSLANGGNFNPGKWNWSSGKTWGFMLGGAVIGGVAGGAGAAIATSGIPMANTIGLAAASVINSGGLALLTGGDTDVMISLGILSFNFSNGSFGYLAKKGNNLLTNVGYAFGGLANLADINLLINSTKSVLYTQKNDMISHSSIAKEGSNNALISYGPGKPPTTGVWGAVNRTKANLSDLHPGGGLKKFALAFQKSTSDYPQYYDLPVKLNLNRYVLNAVAKIGEYLPYQGLTTNCTNMASLSLWLNGIPNIGIHPYILYGTTYMYSVGARPDMFSHHLTNKYNK